MPDEEDIFQQRYRSHQNRKRDILTQLILERHSNRVFDDRPVSDIDLRQLVDAVGRAPSSCDRRAIRAQVVTERDPKALLGGLLVGGVGWIHRAPAVLLLHADSSAYKAGDEVRWMPYLDAGAAVGMLYLAAGSMDLACCFVNPNIRETNREFFGRTFGPGMFCGALAVGHPRTSEPDWVGDTS